MEGGRGGKQAQGSEEQRQKIRSCGLINTESQVRFGSHDKNCYGKVLTTGFVFSKARSVLSEAYFNRIRAKLIENIVVMLPILHCIKSMLVHHVYCPCLSLSCNCHDKEKAFSGKTNLCQRT